MNNNWLIPDLGEKHANTRAAVLVYFLVFTITILLILFAANSLIETQSNFPLLQFATLNVVMLLIFRYTKSFFITGNIIAFCVAIATYNLSLNTGGIFSEDTQFSYIVPLIGFLIAGKRSGVFWFIVSLGWIFYTHHLAATPEDIANFRNQILGYDQDYYLIMCLTNLFVICTVLYILSSQYHKLFDRLKKNKQDLEIHQKQLQNTQAKLEKSNRELDQYAHSTAHDLKQPIRTIYSFIGLLDKELQKSNSNPLKVDEYIDIVKSSAGNMNLLVTDLLEYS